MQGHCCRCRELTCAAQHDEMNIASSSLFLSNWKMRALFPSFDWRCSYSCMRSIKIASTRNSFVQVHYCFCIERDLECQIWVLVFDRSTATATNRDSLSRKTSKANICHSTLCKPLVKSVSLSISLICFVIDGINILFCSSIHLQRHHGRGR